MIETTVHIVWDEEGNVAAHVDAARRPTFSTASPKGGSGACSL